MKLSLEQDLKIRDLFKAGEVDKMLELVAGEIEEALDYALEDQEGALSVEFERGRVIGAEEMQSLADKKILDLEAEIEDRENYWKMSLEEGVEIGSERAYVRGSREGWEKGFEVGYQKALERLLEPNDDALNTAYASGYVDGSERKDCPNG